MSSKDNDKERIMHSKSDNIEIMINDKVDEITEQFFQLLSRYQNGLKTSIKSSGSIVEHPEKITKIKSLFNK